MLNLNKHTLKLVLIYSGIVLLFLISCLIQINKPILEYQNEYAFGANYIIKTGLPIFSFEGYQFSLTTGIVHTPIYLYTLVFFVKLFGLNNLGFKFSAILFTILNSILIFFIAKYFSKDKIIPFLSSFLYLIHPLVIQNALFLSIDGGILTFLTLLFIYIFLNYKLENFYLLSLLLVLILWTKPQNFILLLTSLGLYYIIFEKNKIKNILNITCLSVISGIVFLITFYIYTQISNLDFLELFKLEFSVVEHSTQQGILLYIFRVIYNMKNFVIWITPPFFLYMIYKLFNYSYLIWKKTISFFEAYIFCFLLTVFCFFAVLGINYSGFAKHAVLLIPLFCIIFSKDIIKYLKDIKIDYKLIILITGILLYLFFIIKDPIYTIDIWKIPTQMDIFVALSVLFKILLILLPIGFLLFYFKFNLIKSICFYSLIFILYASIFTTSASYTTNIYYGDNGFDEAYKYLEENVNKDQMATLIVPYHFAFKWNKGEDFSSLRGGAYLYNTLNYYTFDRKLFEKAILSPNNTFLVTYKKDLYRIEGIEEITNNNFYLLNTIGSYSIYKLKSNITQIDLSGFTPIN